MFAESAKASVDAEIDRGFTADLFVQAERLRRLRLHAGGRAHVAEIDGVDQMATVQRHMARITYPDGDDADTFIGAVDPQPFADRSPGPTWPRASSPTSDPAA